MPLYEYECQQCNHRFEKIQSFSAEPETACPKCGGTIEKLLSAPAFQFKGAGWYVSDYSAKGAAARKAESGDSASSSAVAKNDGKSSSDSSTASSAAVSAPSKAD